MPPQNVTGFNNYTNELIRILLGLFVDEEIDSRPIKYDVTIIWLDAEQRIHRHIYPAIERANGHVEYWENGIQKH